MDTSESTPTKPNWLGIASVAIGLSVVCSCLGILVIPFPNGNIIMNAIQYRNDGLWIILLIALVIPCALILLGLVLAILAMMQKKQKRTWGVIGLIFNSILLCLGASFWSGLAVFICIVIFNVLKLWMTMAK